MKVKSPFCILKNVKCVVYFNRYMHCCEHDVLDFFKHCQNDWKTKSDNLSTLRGWGVKGCLNFFQIVRGSFFSFFHFLDTWSLPSQLDWERSKCAHSQNCPQASNSHKQCGFRLKVFSILLRKVGNQPIIHFSSFK